MLAGDRFGFHAVVGHDLSLCVAMELACRELAHQVHRSANRSILGEYVHLNRTFLPDGLSP